MVYFAESLYLNLLHNLISFVCCCEKKNAVNGSTHTHTIANFVGQMRNTRNTVYRNEWCDVIENVKYSLTHFTTHL